MCPSREHRNADEQPARLPKTGKSDRPRPSIKCVMNKWHKKCQFFVEWEFSEMVEVTKERSHKRLQNLV